MHLTSLLRKNRSSMIIRPTETAIFHKKKLPWPQASRKSLQIHLQNLPFYRSFRNNNRLNQMFPHNFSFQNGHQNGHHKKVVPTTERHCGSKLAAHDMFSNQRRCGWLVFWVVQLKRCGKLCTFCLAESNGHGVIGMKFCCSSPPPQKKDGKL